MPSYKPEVIADSSGQWCANGQRFATREEAKRSVDALEMRWFAVKKTRVVESDDAPNYAWVDGRLVGLDPIIEVIGAK